MARPFAAMSLAVPVDEGQDAEDGESVKSSNSSGDGEDGESEKSSNSSGDGEDGGSEKSSNSSGDGLPHKKTRLDT